MGYQTTAPTGWTTGYEVTKSGRCSMYWSSDSSLKCYDTTKATDCGGV